MQLSFTKLSSYLAKQPLAPLYFICGNIPLLIRCAVEMILETFYSQMFHRHALFIDNIFNPATLKENLENLDLFENKTVFDIRYFQNCTGPTVTTLSNFVTNPTPNKHIIVSTYHYLTPAEQQTTWFKIIQKLGVVIKIWPLNQLELVAWGNQYAKKLNLTFDEAVMQQLVLLTRQDINGLKQAIDKIHLYQPEDPSWFLTQAGHLFLHTSGNSSISTLTRAILEGNISLADETFIQLREQGTDSTLILWSLSKLLKQCYELQNGVTENIIASDLKNDLLLQKAAQRFENVQWAFWIRFAQNIEQILKGFTSGKGELALRRLIAGMCGEKIFAPGMIACTL